MPGRDIALRAQHMHIATWHRAVLCGNRRADGPAFQPVVRHILIVDAQIKQHVGCRREGGDKPGRQAVSGHGQRDARREGGLCTQRAHHLRLQKGHVLGVFGQPRAQRCGAAGLAAGDQRRAHPFLKRLQALGNGRRRDIQRPGCRVETA